MKLLEIFTDKKLNLTGEKETGPEKVREAARAIVLNKKGQIALLYTEKHGHHKLPGGGIENGEDFRTALERECIEEIGCKVAVQETAIGKIQEHRNLHNFKQTSYCGIADLQEDLGTVALTESEMKDGFSAPKWVTLKEAQALFDTDKPKTYIGAYMHARDKTFIEEFVQQKS